MNQPITLPKDFEIDLRADLRAQYWKYFCRNIMPPNTATCAEKNFVTVFSRKLLFFKNRVENRNHNSDPCNQSYDLKNIFAINIGGKYWQF
jgi:hypothetical protein